MNAHYRFYPLPRPSLKSDHSIRTCSCNTPCSGDNCRNFDNYKNYSEASTPPYPPLPPSPHVHFLGLCQTYVVDYDYDRSSTVVSPNECALPARGCPGRTYFSSFEAARSGRRMQRCGTPGPSRANSRSRNNMSPPPSPSFYAQHIFYPEYPFPSPLPSPRVLAPSLVPDTNMSPQPSDDSDAGLSTPPELQSQAAPTPVLSRRGTFVGLGLSHTGGQPPIDAPGHPPIPGLTSPTPRGKSDFFSITNALNGLDIGSGGGYSMDGLGWSKPPSEATSPKKPKAKKQSKRVKVSMDGWSNDSCLGGF